MVKFWQRLSILITIESLLLGILCFTPFLILETNNLTTKKTAFKIFIYQYTAVSFICLFALFLFIYAIPHFAKQKRAKKTYLNLSTQALLLNENSKIRNETILLIEKLQHTTHTAPELILKILRYYSMQSYIPNEKSAFSPAQQAGIVISCLDAKSLKRIFKRMQKSEIKLFQQLAHSLGHITSEDKFQVLSKFLSTLTEPVSKIENPHFSDTVLPSQQAIKIIKKENCFSPKTNIWDTLDSISSEKIASYLKNESSQSIAIILYNLSDKKAGEVLSFIPKEVSCSALLRLTALKSLSKKRLTTLETSLESHFLNIAPQVFYYGLEKASSILSIMPTHQKNELLLKLTETSPQIAKKLSHQIICFDDLSHLSNKDICELIKKVPENILTTALLGADNNTKEIFLKNISPKRLSIFLKQSNLPRSEKIKEIDEAQYFVIKKAHVLMSKKQRQGL